jgi:putative drug exporter of the RND superfamily
MTDVASYAVDVVILFGLALAVDSSLLMVNWFREERAAGADVPLAVEQVTSRAGRTVTFSALTVAASLAGCSRSAIRRSPRGPWAGSRPCWSPWPPP